MKSKSFLVVLNLDVEFDCDIDTEEMEQDIRRYFEIKNDITINDDMLQLNKFDVISITPVPNRDIRSIKFVKWLSDWESEEV